MYLNTVRCLQVAAAEGDAQAARAALDDTSASERARLPQTDATANAAALEEVTVLRATNAELQSRASYLEAQLIQQEKLLGSMPDPSAQTTPKSAVRAVQTCAHPSRYILKYRLALTNIVLWG